MIAVPLILAHLLGDFLLQPNLWVTHKEQRKARSRYLYLHILVHTALSFVLLWDYRMWWVAAATGISHLLIDSLKLYLQKPKTKRQWFFADQAMHLVVILCLAGILGEFSLDFLRSEKTLAVIAGAFFLTTPASMFIRILLSAWTPVPVAATSMQTESLTNAGKYIGILERLIVFTFILLNHWEGVGFMIAAKSVFRFSDLAEAKQRKLTEYVLIGTLLSFGMAVLTGIILNTKIFIK